jgi:hypothetical protein
VQRSSLTFLKFERQNKKNIIDLRRVQIGFYYHGKNKMTTGKWSLMT